MTVVERLSTTLTPLAPEGSTPNALAIDRAKGLTLLRFSPAQKFDDTEKSEQPEAAQNEGFGPLGKIAQKHQNPTDAYAKHGERLVPAHRSGIHPANLLMGGGVQQGYNDESP